MFKMIFTAFDGYSSPNLPLNWIAIGGGLIFLTPSSFFLTNSRSLLMKNMVMEQLKSEYSMILGPSSVKVKSWLVSLFAFIVILNFFGLMPYVFTPTSAPSLNFSLSLMVWVSVMLGWLMIPLNNFLSHLVPTNTPYPLIPFMVLIELVSSSIRPITLAVRLSANMVAGHLLIQLINSAPLNILLVIISLFGGVVMFLLEIAVSVIQAYVFTTLSCLYFSELNEVKMSEKY